MVLFPEERLDDWKAAEEKQTRDAEDLSFRWKDRSFADLVNQLVMWHQQSEEFGRVWPQMLPVFSKKLAEIRNLNSSELSLALAKLPSRTVGPFLDRAIACGAIASERLQLAIKRPELHGILIDCTLSGKTPELYGQLVHELPNWESLIESLCVRNEVSAEMLKNLLQHEDDHLRREVAFYSLRAESGIPDSLRSLWRKVVIEALINVAIGDDEPPYDLDKILSADPTIGPEVLEGVIASDDPFIGYRSGGLLCRLVNPLSKEERRKLLHRIKHHTYSSLPRLLVGRDPELFQEMLGIPELKGAYSGVLVGDPNASNWTALAKIALASGHSHQQISHTVHSDGYSWSGRLSNLLSRMGG